MVAAAAVAHIADKALKWQALTAVAAALEQAAEAHTPTAAATNPLTPAAAMAACLAAAVELANTAKAALAAQQQAAVHQVMTNTRLAKSASAGAAMASSLFSTKSSSKETHHDKVRTFLS